MGENAQKIGKKLELLGVDLLSLFHWTKKMGDKEILCTRSNHKNSKGNKKRTHGIDLYMEYFDPYIGGVQGVFIECKNRQWSGISKDQIQNWINEEINLMECAKANTDLQDFFSEGADKYCALLLINCNDDKYNHESFLEYLNNISIPNKRIPYRIFIASNYMIEKWDAIIHMIKEEYSQGIKVLYPSINNTQPISAEHWSINHLYSKYIFCETEEEISYGRTEKKVEKVLVIFFLDKINAESILYMWSMCRFFQYENQYNAIDICFWTDTKEEHDYIIENFVNILSDYDNGKIDKQQIERIQKRFLLNRKLNVVDNR